MTLLIARISFDLSGNIFEIMKESSTTKAISLEKI